jgi:hypothetical protein
MARSAACPGGSKTKRPQDYLAHVTACLPRDSDLDIEQGCCLQSNPVRRHSLPLCHRLDAQPPTEATAVIAARVPLDQGSIPPNRSQVGLRTLQRLFGPSRGVNREEAAAPGLKKPNQRQRGDRQRHHDLEQGKAGCATDTVNAHRQL